MKEKKFLKIFIIIALIFTLFSISLANIKQITNYITNELVGVNINVEKIDVKGLKIELNNITLAENDGTKIGKINKAIIKVNPLLPTRISSVEIIGGNVKVVQYKNGEINFEKIFPKNDKETFENKSYVYNAKFRNIQVEYVNKMFEKEIRKNLFDVSGTFNDLSLNDFSINASGFSIGEITKEKEKIALSIRNESFIDKNIFSIFSLKKDNNKASYIKLNFENVDITEELSQFSPLDMLVIKNGKINGNLEIFNENINAKLNLSSNDIELKNSNFNFNNTNVNIDVVNNNVKALGKSYFMQNLIDFKTSFNINDKILEVDAKSDDIDVKKIFNAEKSSGKVKVYLKTKVKINDNIQFDKLDFNISSDKIKLSDIELNNLLLTIKDKDNNNLKLDFNTNINGKGYIPSDFSINMLADVNKQKAQGNFTLYNKMLDKKVIGDILIDTFNHIEIKADDDLIYLHSLIKDKKLNLKLHTKKDIILQEKDIKFSTNLSIDNLDFSFENNKLDADIKAIINIISGKNKTNLNISSNLNNDRLKSNIELNTNGKILNVFGTTNKNLNHNYNIKGYVDTKNLIKLFDNTINNEYYGILKSNGKIYGNKDSINLEYDISSEIINYGFEIRNFALAGKLTNILKSPITYNKFYLGELWLSYQRFDNVSGSIDLKNNFVNVELENRNLRAKLLYDLKNKYLTSNLDLKDYMLYSTLNPDINILISDLKLVSRGNISNLKTNINISPSIVMINNHYLGKIISNVNIEDNILDIVANLNENTIIGKYSLDTKEVNLDILIYDEINRYLKIEDLKADIVSNISINGKIDNLKATFDMELNEFKFKKYQAPSVKILAEYENGNIKNILRTGKLSVKEFSVYSNEDNKNIYNANFELDLSNLNIDYKTKNNTFDISKLGSDFSGNIEFNAKLKGNLDAFFAELVVHSDNLVIKGNKITNFIINGQATESGVNITQGYLEYEDNPILISAYSFFGTDEHKLKIVAENFDLDFLNINPNISNAKGIANIDFVATKESVYGNVEIKDFSMKTKDYNIEDFNVKIDMLNKDINIEEFSGDINGGGVYLAGILSLPTVSENFTRNNKLVLGKFDLELYLSKVPIKYKNNEITLSSNLLFKGDNISGDIVLNNAKITNLSFIEEKKESKANFIKNRVDKILDIILSQIRADIDFNIENPVVIDIPSYLVVNDIQANLQGNSNITYRNNKLSIFGDYEVYNAKFELNGNTFDVENLSIKFDGLNDVSSLDPLINLKTITTIDGEYIEIFMNSRLSEKKIEYKSQNNKTRDEILSLLTLKGSNINVSSINTIGSNFVNIAAETAINQFISSFTNKIGKRIGLTKLEVSANIIDKDKLEFSNLLNNANIQIHTQGEILKNRNIYWNVKTTIPFDTKNDQFKYDLSLSYNIADGLDANAGIKSQEFGNLNNVEEKGLEKINFYTGINYSNKFHDISEFTETLSNIFKKKEKLKKEYEDDKE